MPVLLLKLIRLPKKHEHERVEITIIIVKE